MKLSKNCPQCGNKNTDDWPLEIDGEIKEGGCQICWESQTGATFWEVVEAIIYAEMNEQFLEHQRKMKRKYEC